MKIHDAHDEKQETMSVREVCELVDKMDSDWGDYAILAAARASSRAVRAEQLRIAGILYEGAKAHSGAREYDEERVLLWYANSLVMLALYGVEDGKIW